MKQNCRYLALKQMKLGNQDNLDQIITFSLINASNCQYHCLKQLKTLESCHVMVVLGLGITHQHIVNILHRRLGLNEVEGGEKGREINYQLELTI